MPVLQKNDLVLGKIEDLLDGIFRSALAEEWTNATLSDPMNEIAKLAAPQGKGFEALVKQMIEDRLKEAGEEIKPDAKGFIAGLNDRDWEHS